MEYAVHGIPVHYVEEDGGTRVVLLKGWVVDRSNPPPL